MKRNILTIGVATGVAVLLTACGGGSGGSASSSPKKTTPKSAVATAPTSTTAAAPPTVQLGNTRIGAVLVDTSGMTLYELDHDSASTATCTGTCAALWPPVTATPGSAPVAGTGLDATKLSVVTGANGQQVEYGGHPLYRFASDKAPGDVNGQGFAGGIWWTVGADGNKVTAAAAASGPAPTMAPATTPAPTMGSGSRMGY